MGARSEAGRLTFRLADLAATACLAEDIAAMLAPGDLIGLSGGLGAGKTSFARALIRTLAGDAAYDVPSPTFPIRIDHDLTRLRIVHADLYRLAGSGELDEIGLAESLDAAAVLVEWPEQLPGDLAANRLDVAFAIAGDGRVADIGGTGTWPERLARTNAIRAFVEHAGWPAAARRPLAGDASSRAYERVWRPEARPLPLPGRERPSPRESAEPSEGLGAVLDVRDPHPLGYRRVGLSRPGRGEAEPHSAVLMNAPARPEGAKIYGGRSYDAVAHRARDVRAFVAIADALRRAGVRAPRIYAADMEAGLLLLEDLGAEGILDADGAPIPERYEAAIDLLAFMHRRKWPEALPLPGGETYRMPAYDREALLVEISLFPDWFGGHGGEPAFPQAERAPFLAAWSDVLASVEDGPKTLVLRDFHAPNILWQEAARGTDRVAVLDFQDALIGHPAYDAASLAQDARAAVSEAAETRLQARYVAARRADDPSFDAESFAAAYAVLAAQRATKVLGAFTRLALVDNKPGYQRHRARLKGLLRRTLLHPVLSGLRRWYEPYL